MKKRVKEELSNVVKIVVGCFIFALGFQYVTYPNGIVSGGIMGIAMIINNLWNNLPVGVLTIVLNIPLFIFAWKKFGMHFIFLSLLGMILSSSLVDVLSIKDLVLTRDPLLAALYGGLIKGLGFGMIYATGATAGGVDIVAKYLRKKHPSINFGTLILMMDAIVIVTYAIIFKRYDSAMFAVISVFVFSKVVDFVLYGAVNVKACYIITDKSDKSNEIKEEICRQLGRGATVLEGQGAYSGRDKQIVLCVLKSNQIVTLRKLVWSIDDKAFLIINDARTVYGRGFESATGS